MSEQNVTKKSRKKLIIMLVSIVLAVTVAVVGTLAYLFHITDNVVNVFTPTEVTCKVDETFENNIKTNVSIQNTSNIDAFIRVAVLANWKQTSTQPYVIAENEENRARLSLEKTVFAYGEAINVTATGKGKDFISIYPLEYPEVYPDNGAGCIRWSYIKDNTSENTNSTTTRNIREGTISGGIKNYYEDEKSTNFYENISPGDYVVALVLDDGNPNIGGDGRGFATFYENGTVPGNCVAYTVIHVVPEVEDYGEVQNEVLGTEPVLGVDYTLTLGDSEDWVLGADGYYYFTKEVAPGANTDVLIAQCQPVEANVPYGYSLMVTIVPSAIQSRPDYVVGELWGGANDKVNISADDGVLSVTAK